MTRNYLPSPGAVVEQMNRVRRHAERLIELADHISSGYTEVHEAGLWSGGSNGSITPGGRGGADSDPTGQTATSGTHAILRGQARQAARVLRRLEPLLDEAEGLLTKAFITALDPDTRAKLAIAEETSRDYERRRRGA